VEGTILRTETPCKCEAGTTARPFYSLVTCRGERTRELVCSSEIYAKTRRRCMERGRGGFIHFAVV